MRIYVIIITLLFSLSSNSQDKKQFRSGKIYKVYGQITDKATKDTLSVANIEFMDTDDTIIKATLSDFDGMYVLSFCSNKLKNDTLVIKAAKAYYKQHKMSYRIHSDTVINIGMTLDKNRNYMQEEIEQIERRFYDCGLHVPYEVDELEYQENKTTYRHYCSGTEKKYRTLIDENENISEWILIEK